MRMRGNEVNEKKWLRLGIVVVLALALWKYAKLPDYEVRSSNRLAFNNYVESTVNVIVYKKLFSSELYEDIESEYVRVNGEPDKLILKLLVKILDLLLLSLLEKDMRTYVRQYYDKSFFRYFI